MTPKPLSEVADRNLDFYRKQAKALLKAARAGDRSANDRLRTHLGEGKPNDDSALHMAQLAIAREQGFASWPRFHAFITESNLDFHALVDRFIDAATLDGHRARQILSDHPEITDAGVYIALVLGQWGRVADALDLDSGLVNSKSGPQNCELLVYVCFSRFAHPRSERATDLVLTARLLLSRGADPDTAAQTDDGALSCLYAAAGLLANPELTQVLLEAGADPNDEESLYHATEHQDLACLRLLLEHGARVPGSNALKHMLDREAPDGVRLLLDFGADPNEANPQGETALHWAVRRSRSSDVVALLLDSGADPDAVRDDGRTAYAMAVVSGQTAIADLLASRGADTRLSALDAFVSGQSLTVPEESAQSPANARLLVQLAEAGKMASVKALLNAGVPVDAVGDGGETSLHWACWTGNADLARLLIQEGAPLEEKDGMYDAAPSGWLHHGASMGRTGDYDRCARLLIQAGASMSGCEMPSGNAGFDAVLRETGKIV